MKRKNLVSGARLSDGGLHLGHYLGCLSPLSEFPEQYYDYFFIMADTSLPYRLIDPGKDEALIDMASDLLSTEYSDRIKIVLQSKINCEAPILLSTLKHLMTLKQVQSVHPRWKQIREHKLNCSLEDFIFILNEVYNYLSLDTSYVLTNDDNLRFVRYAKRISKKINNIYGHTTAEPTLKHGIVPRLLGYDLQRMTKSNKNAISLSEDREDLRRKVVQLISSGYMRRLVNLDSSAHLIHPFTATDSFLPFTYLKVFCAGEESKSIIDLFQRGRISLYELAEEVFRILDVFLGKMREPRAFYKNHPADIWRRIESDTQQAIEIVHDVETRVVSSIRKSMH